jgi:hypothetical protein
MTKSAWEFAEPVAKGMKLLDELLGPDWVETVNLSELNLASECNCILGQKSFDICGVHHSFGDALNATFVGPEDEVKLASEQGFYAGNGNDYPALTQAWNNAIVARRRETQ